MSKARELEEERRDVIKLSNRATSIVRLLATATTTLIGTKILWELLTEFSLSPDGAWELVQITVLIYFLVWFLAALKGIEIQSLLLNSTGSSGRIPLSGIFRTCCWISTWTVCNGISFVFSST